ncbi:polyprenyl synthetase family protein [Promineifilum sp.]|uniref:polyprenyl synthetase family protein n=1 Tax=Promineifilum sp. TaxID=2664178 RepID=UPI0035AEB485
MSDELSTFSAAFLPAVEAEMRAVLRADGADAGLADPFYGMMHYHMGWADEALQPAGGNSGKRIRPILCLLACAAAGGDWRQAVPAAAAIEILHNFSLVHDDIEDDSPTRRGRRTLWTLWGQPQAINTGDGMFALAHLALGRLAERGVPPATVVRALRHFDETSVALTRGQHADMTFETRPAVAVAEYVAMITGKTAVLVALCAELGALVAGADDARVSHFAAFGLNLGLAFQVQDDILGIWGDEALTGKSAATDITTRKKTLPVLYALERSAALRELYDAPAEDDRTFVRRAVALLDEAGARAYAVERAADYSDEALAHLAAARPVEPGAAALRQLTDMLLRRDF